MLRQITIKQRKMITELIERMSIKEKIAQILCWNINKETPKQILSVLEKMPLGSVFIGRSKPERIAEIVKAITINVKTPVIVSADLEHGCGPVIEGTIDFPFLMACGAADNADLAENMGRATAREGRAHGFHWTFSPVVDLSININSKVTNVRCFGEKPEHIVKLAGAYVKGVQQDGLMAVTCKHFPGDGIDDRDQHFCTSVNSLSRKEWEATYGYVWRHMIDQGAMAIMVGHIALPFIDSAATYLGPPPATLSRKIQVDFLRNELGFAGLIVSDAMVMGGCISHVPSDKLSVANIMAGSDMVLFAKPKKDSKNLYKALNDGQLTQERLDNAVKHVLELKVRVGLLDNKNKKISKLAKKEIELFKQTDDKIAKRSIKIIRNESSLIPVKLNKGAEILTVTIKYPGNRPTNMDLTTVDKELILRGFKVDHLVNPNHAELISRAKNYEVVFVNIAILPHSLVGTIGLTGEPLMSFWRPFWTNHKGVIFTSFGSPYLIYELPAVPNYINVFSNSASSQKAAVKVWLGEEKAPGKNPVRLDGYFEVEV